jgi:hypothetical protein
MEFAAVFAPDAMPLAAVAAAAAAGPAALAPAPAAVEPAVVVPEDAGAPFGARVFPSWDDK